MSADAVAKAFKGSVHFKRSMQSLCIHGALNAQGFLISNMFEKSFCYVRESIQQSKRMD